MSSGACGGVLIAIALNGAPSVLVPPCAVPFGMITRSPGLICTSLSPSQIVPVPSKSSRYLFLEGHRLSRGVRSPQGQPLRISIADITTAFPDYRVAFVVAEGLTIAPERPAALDALIARREEAARAKWSGTELA